jgi:GxxExxY protein
MGLSLHRYTDVFFHRKVAKALRNGKNILRYFYGLRLRNDRIKCRSYSLMEKTSPSSVEELDRLSRIILEAAIAVHREMGPGLLESIYQHCLIRELRNRQVRVDSPVIVALHYKGEPLDKDYIIDILVEDEIILELKAIEEILPVHKAQIISYLKLANKRLGFLINFNTPLLKHGFKRYVNNL